MTKVAGNKGSRGEGAPRFLGGVREFRTVETLGLGQEPRVAFVGRSNVGKSSLLNALTAAKIARVSQQPGKTREINYFEWRGVLLVDLPGYGYAKVGQELRSLWGREIPRFLTDDNCMALVVSLIDGNVGFTKDDDELIGFIAERQMPAVVVFTKMDKFKSNNQRKNAERLLGQAAQERGVEKFLFVAAEKNDGIAALKRSVLDATR